MKVIVIGSPPDTADVFRLLPVVLDGLTNKAARADDFRTYVQKHQDSL